MIFRIEAAHTRDRYLSYKQNFGIVINCLDSTFDQEWALIQLNDTNIYYIKSIKDEKLCLAAPREKGRAILLDDIQKYLQEGKWLIQSVQKEKYNADYFFIRSFTQVDTKIKNMEMAVDDEGTENGSKVVLWNHKDIAKVGEPRNQMWILHPIR